MRKISDHADTLGKDKLIPLAETLGMETHPLPRPDRIVASLLTRGGLNRVIASLSPDELAVLSAALSDSAGITYGDMEKSLRIGLPDIEKTTSRLSAKLLVYVLKNRQLLHNRLDKVHVPPEVRAIIRPAGLPWFREHFEACRNRLEESRGGGKTWQSPFKKNTPHYRVIKKVFECGGMALLEEAEGAAGAQAEKTIAELEESGLITVRHYIEKSFRTLLLLNPDVCDRLASFLSSSEGHVSEFDNRFHMLLNLLFTYDAVSTAGLFLTKQREYRKTDWKRLTDSMLTIRDADGRNIENDVLVRLCLHFLYVLECARLKREAVTVTLRPLEKDLDDPMRLLLRVLRTLNNREADSAIFTSPFKLPAYATILHLIETVSSMRRVGQHRLFIHFCANAFAGMDARDIAGFPSSRDEELSEFNSGLRLLALCGIMESTEAGIALSETGVEAAVRLLKGKKAPEREHKTHKNIYINPDFTVIIPKNETPPEACYHILAHTELIKDDIILHTRISKASIVKAGKRGMKQDEFISALERHSKNRMPQNLSFLLHEWSNQTARINIMDATLIHSTHPSLIDEISYGGPSMGIVERISPHYAIIDRSCIDQIVKLAQKKDALITLFEEGEADI